MIIANASPKHGGYFLMRIVALMGYRHYAASSVRYRPDDALIYGGGRRQGPAWSGQWPERAKPEPGKDGFIRGYISYNSEKPVPHKIITISRDPRNAALSWLYSRMGAKYHWNPTAEDLMRLLRECGEPIGKGSTYVDFCRGYLGWFPEQGVWMEDVLTDDGHSIRKIRDILGGSKSSVEHIQKNAFGGESAGTLGPRHEVLIARQSSWSKRKSWSDWRGHKLWTRAVEAVWQEIAGPTLIQEIEELREKGKAHNT